MVIVKELILAGLLVGCPAIASAECVTQVMEISAYTSNYDECGSDEGITASGEIAIPYLTCAADHLPFGTVVIVDGQEWIVMDRFGAGYEDKLDLHMTTKDECFEFGRQVKEVLICYE